jgi:hypothetical protein
MRYSKNGKFLDVYVATELVHVSNAHKQHKKHVIELLVHVENKPTKIVLVGSKCGFLADFLDMGRHELYALVRRGEVETLNSLLSEQGRRVMKISANLFRGQWYAFNVATKAHVTITFSQVRHVVTQELSDYAVTETEVGRSLAWEATLSEMHADGDAHHVRLRVMSGRNTKSRAIKVILYVHRLECANDMYVEEYEAIKHLRGWESRLRAAINAALVKASTIEETIKNPTPLTLQAGLEYINSLSLPIRKKEKIEYIRNLLQVRLAIEFGEEKDGRHALSRALSWVGTHDNPKLSSQHTLDVLCEAAYAIHAISQHS